MLTNSTDRPFAPGDLQRSVEKYTGSYVDSTFVPTMHKIVSLTVIGDLREHKGSMALYCNLQDKPFCTVKVDRCADRSICRRLITFLMFRN